MQLGHGRLHLHHHTSAALLLPALMEQMLQDLLTSVPPCSCLQVLPPWRTTVAMRLGRTYCYLNPKGTNKGTRAALPNLEPLAQIYLLSSRECVLSRIFSPTPKLKRDVLSRSTWPSSGNVCKRVSILTVLLSLTVYSFLGCWCQGFLLDVANKHHFFVSRHFNQWKPCLQLSALIVRIIFHRSSLTTLISCIWLCHTCVRMAALLTFVLFWSVFSTH